MTVSVLQDVSLDSALTQLASSAATPFEQAKPMPATLNHSRAFFEHELKRVFSREWICIGRADELPGAGDYLCHRIAGVAVLAVRQTSGEIHAFVNACAHRRAQLVSQDSGSAKRFTCPYHAWTYDCDGSLIRAPHMEMKPEFNASDHRLAALHCDTWEGFVYVSLARQPETSLAQALEPLRTHVVGRYQMDVYRTVLRDSLSWPANWKNLIENFTESYHVPVAHGKTFARHLKAPEDYVCGEDSDYYGYHYAAQAADHGLGAAHAENDRLQGDWRRTMVDFCVFPCHLITLMPDYLWWISVQPASPDRFEATWGVAFPPEVLAQVDEADYRQWLSDFKQYMDTANDEDKALVTALHQGSASPLLPAGTYHPMERNLWQFTRYLARVCEA